ncbi:alkaline phosphatase [Micropruina sp.]|uniref:alkaline phosphatase n=1 Tax=Micropruina sp. TaxID=2737536 RepID=UPI00263559FB|nr:alkaline phosphatase [Micropruina sp.]
MPNKSSAPWTVLAGRGGGVAAVAVAALLASSLSGPSTTQASPATQPQGLNAAPDRISAPDVVPAKVSAGKRARNVIFIQGDGMGIAHRELIRLALKGQGGELTMNKMQYTGLVHTESADKKEAVTDSAAAATAYATGVRSYNGAIGVDSDGKPVTSLLERARAAGKSTGVVTTSQVTDASPGAFSAHVANRSDQSEIARQIIEQTRVDVVLGGGEDWWYPAGNPGAWPDNPPKDPTEQSKGTKGNLVDRAQQLGYKYVRNAAELKKVNRGKVLGLFANEEMFEYHNEGEGDLYDPSVRLPVMTKKAINILSRDRDGFFLFVEEEGIDEMAHHSNAKLMIKAGAELDRTVKIALDFAARTPGTLVLVVGDHETGGLAIENVDPNDENGSGEQSEDTIPIAHSDLKMVADWTTGGHTGAATPVTASGPGAHRLSGFIKNTDVHDAVLKAMGFRP